MNGTRATLLTYDGSFIAPTIRARSGDEVRLHFRNGLPATGDTNLLGIANYRVGLISQALEAFASAAQGGLEAGRQNLVTVLRAQNLDRAATTALERFSQGRPGGALLEGGRRGGGGGGGGGEE